MDWLRMFRVKERAETAAAGSSPLPEGTWVSSAELIALQRFAGAVTLDSIRASRSAPAGGHGSRFRGRGMDYEESRTYQPGDDVRSMDWRVTARTGQAHVKVYEEERDRPTVLLLDFNPGMYFASHGRFKSVQAARLAALIAWATVARGDRIGAVISNGGHLELPPRGAAKGALELIRQLVQVTEPRAALQTPAPTITLEESLKRLRRVARPGSLVFVVSDFYALDAAAGDQLMQLRRHNDLVAVHVCDALETGSLPAGRYGISDGRQQATLALQSAAETRRYRESVADYLQRIEQLGRRCAMPVLRLTTTDDVVEVLRKQGRHAGSLPQDAPA